MADLATARPAGYPAGWHREPAVTCGGWGFSPDGKLLATVHDDGTLRLWNPDTEQPVGFPVTADAGGNVIGVAFSPDGKLLATSDDNTGGDTVDGVAPALADPHAALCAAVGRPGPGSVEAVRLPAAPKACA